MEPFPFASTNAERGVTHDDLPELRNNVAVASDTWIRFFCPVVSIREATSWSDRRRVVARVFEQTWGMAWLADHRHSQTNDTYINFTYLYYKI